MSAFNPVFSPCRFVYDERIYGDCQRPPPIPYGYFPSPFWFEYPPLPPPEFMWPFHRSPGIPVGALREFSARQRTDKTYEKPSLSYVGLIAEAILSSPEKRLVLGDIYAFIAENYPYFGTKGNGWRNSIRHNLSLNDCFVKGERSPSGKGHFWEVNPLCHEELFNGTAKQRPRKRTLKPPSQSTDTCDIIKKEETSTERSENKLELLSQLKYEDEIRQFEAASQKLMDDEERPPKKVCPCHEKTEPSSA